MRLLPREHGATVIWFASLLLAFAALRKPPNWFGLIVYVGVAVVALVLLGRFTKRSAMVARLERSRVLLPALSASLTVLIPVGQLLMVGQLSRPVLSAWLVFLTFVAAGVVATRELVRDILKARSTTWAGLVGAGTVLAAEGATLALVHWLSPVAITVVVPLTLQRWFATRRIRNERIPRSQRIRFLGFTQSASLVAAATILALATFL